VPPSGRTPELCHYDYLPFGKPAQNEGEILKREGGHSAIEWISQISINDIAGDLARQSGLEGVIDRSTVAKHSGANFYLIDFPEIADLAS
jgi:hypothetical protein